MCFNCPRATLILIIKINFVCHTRQLTSLHWHKFSVCMVICKIPKSKSQNYLLCIDQGISQTSYTKTLKSWNPLHKHSNCSNTQKYLGRLGRQGTWHCRWNTRGQVSQQSSSPPLRHTAHQSSFELVSSIPLSPLVASSCCCWKLFVYSQTKWSRPPRVLLIIIIENWTH